MNHYYYHSFVSFSHQQTLMVFYKSLSDSKSFQVSRTLLSILADHNAVVRMVSTCYLISNPSGPFTKLLRIFPSAPIMIGITVISMFHIFLVLKQGPDTYLYFTFL